jgi:hypothetical protein
VLRALGKKGSVLTALGKKGSVLTALGKKGSVLTALGNGSVLVAHLVKEKVTAMMVVMVAGDDSNHGQDWRKARQQLAAILKSKIGRGAETLPRRTRTKDKRRQVKDPSTGGIWPKRFRPRRTRRI